MRRRNRVGFVGRLGVCGDRSRGDQVHGEMGWMEKSTWTDGWNQLGGGVETCFSGKFLAIYKGDLGIYEGDSSEDQ